MSTTTFKPDATELAVDRTWLAYERTLMPWVRAATSIGLVVLITGILRG